MTVLVIGGTGTTGSLVARKLGARGHLTRVASRGGSTDHVRFDWYDVATHGNAVAGADAMYVIAPVGEADPAPIMTPFLDLAADEGVRRAVLLSSSAIEPATPGLGAVHSALAERFGEWAVLRPSWFMENFTGNRPHARSAHEDGEIVSATGEGRVAFIAAEDIAEVAVAALLDAAPHNTDHVLTGPEALSYDEVATILSEASGRTVRHRRLDAGALADRLHAAGLPSPYARLLADLDRLIASGAEDRTTTVVETLTGRPPRRLRDVLAAAHEHNSGTPRPASPASRPE